ncbi:MAG TPA: thiamine-phosphate kinase [Gammaproteobacteria bacterium]|nr:thiamine-phosphate kinase [Gammaproteobacteria bacterium]
MHEFELIKCYFKDTIKTRSDVILGIGDDCALLEPPQKQLLAVSTDTLVENIHFLPGTEAAALGHKSLAVSLSDLAAMGAEPAWVMLSLTLPEANEKWLSEFCQGFFHLLNQYALQLVGGNTTSGPLAITTHITGFVPPGKALQRHGAKLGDDIYITGQPGNAALALRCLQHKCNLATHSHEEITPHLHYPEPRIAAGIALRDIASAAIDVSDGLAADLGHILEQSGVGAEIYAEHLPLSQALATLPQTDAWELMLSGGDDYELCFTANPSQRATITEVFTKLNCPCQRIGVIETATGLRVRYGNNQIFNPQSKGYEHF